MASVPPLFQVNDLIALVISMFNAAPGANNLGYLAFMMESGKKLTDVTHFLAARPEFTQVYPATLSTDAFVTLMASNMLGNEAGAAATNWAINWAKTQLAAGMDRASVITAAMQALRSSTNADFANAKTMLANKVDVASYYSVTKQMSSTSLTALQSVIKDVTSASASVIPPKTLIDNITVDPVSYTYVLTAGTDSITAGVGNDTIYSTAPGYLSANDSIDGGVGNDTLTVTNVSAITIPTGVIVKNVETANLVSAAGITGDVTNWAGLTTLNATTTTGTVAITAAATTDVTVSNTSAAGNAISVTGGNHASVIIKGIAANGSEFTTIADAHPGMKLSFGQAAGTATFTADKVALVVSATFQDYLDAAASSNGAANSKVTWFQYLGNTYVVEDNSASSTYQNGADTLVKLTGLIDLGTAVFTAAAGITASVTLA